MNERERESERQEREDPEQASGWPVFVATGDEPVRVEPQEARNAVGETGENGRRFDRLTQLLASALDRRRLGGAIAGTVLALRLTDAADAKRKQEEVEADGVPE